MVQGVLVKEQEFITIRNYCKGNEDTLKMKLAYRILKVVETIIESFLKKQLDIEVMPGH